MKQTKFNQPHQRQWGSSTSLACIAQHAGLGGKMHSTSKAVMQRLRHDAEVKQQEAEVARQKADGERNMFQTQLQSAQSMNAELTKQIAELTAIRKDLLAQLDRLLSGGLKAAWAILRGRGAAFAKGDA